MVIYNLWKSCLHSSCINRALRIEIREACDRNDHDQSWSTCLLVKLVDYTQRYFTFVMFSIQNCLTRGASAPITYCGLHEKYRHVKISSCCRLPPKLWEGNVFLSCLSVILFAGGPMWPLSNIYWTSPYRWPIPLYRTPGPDSPPQEPPAPLLVTSGGQD